ncbi:MAG: hypothetical protein F6K37_38270 [Moorea sp. SIO4E2]|nr:hypothetical protein [Moorena sp. SIO4E2]OLT65880.1 hypothetical protein BI334_13335 [Moorena producens 3L]
MYVRTIVNKELRKELKRSIQKEKRSRDYEMNRSHNDFTKRLPVENTTLKVQSMAIRNEVTPIDALKKVDS